MANVGEATGSEALDAELYAARAARDAADFASALASYQAAAELAPDDLQALTGMGTMLRALGRERDALPVLLKAIDLDSQHVESRLELALTLQGLGRSDEARAIFTALLRIPDPPARAWHGLALLLLGDGHDLAAEAALRRAINQAPDMVPARQQLADLLAHRLDLAAASDFYHDILTIEPDNADSLAGLGQALIGMGRMDEAQDLLERALAQRPNHALAHLARARLNLLEGHLQGAWEDLEWRWQASGRKRPNAPGQSWDGDAELTGQTILLWAEQGQSEIVHLLRYVPQVAHRAGKVILGLPKVLAPLAKGLEGSPVTLVSGDKLPAGITIDYNASLSDLPRLFGTSLAGIPACPYLEAPAGHRLTVTAPHTALLKIGLAWAGPRSSWNIDFPQLMPLMSRPDAAFFSLQLGKRSADATNLAHPSLISDLSPTISDYADLAGRIAEMDLVITVDGIVAHLAGALGKPVWVLLPVAADWRWLRDRNDTPWYPSARLFRQSAHGDWTEVVTRVMGALDDKLASERQRRQSVAQSHHGSRSAQQAFISTHLQEGDLFVDVGCGSAAPRVMDAACQDIDDIAVLAIEARASEAALLEDTLAIAGLSEIVTVERAVVGAGTAPVAVAARKRSGRAVFALPEWVGGRQNSEPLGAIMARHPQFAGRRMVLRLGAKGQENDILAGLDGIRPAVVVFDHQNGSDTADTLRRMGYSLHHFPSDVAAGPVQPFAGEAGTVLALDGDIPPAPLYGDSGDPTSPASMARASAESATLAAQGQALLAQSKLNEAGALFARSLALDPGNTVANANLGGLLRRIGRRDAAAACWRRALANGAPAQVRSNLANVLRETDRLDEAEATFLRCLAELPDHAETSYAFALLERQLGRPRQALGLMERAEHLRPGTVPGGELAVTLLKSGNLARGMAEMAQRRPAPLKPVNAPEWDGSRLAGKTILVRDEGDAIDTIQLSRFIPMVALQGGLVHVECVPDVAPLMAGLAGVEQVIPRGKPLPAVECSVRLLDVPRLLGTTSRTTPPRNVPYLHLPDGTLPFRFPGDHRLHVGLSWQGSRPSDRGIPVSTLMRLAALPDIDLVSLQRGDPAKDLITTGNRLFVEDMGTQCRDLIDLAALVAGLDLIVTTDTVEAHLAGAMGKPVWVLLPLGNDWRWVDERDDSVWYPTMRVFRQSTDGSWSRALSRVADAMAAMAAGKRGRSGGI